MQSVSRFLRLCLLLIAFCAIAAFVAVNRQPVTLYLWPFKSGLTAQIWVFVLGSMAGGMILGGLAIWLRLLGLRARLWGVERARAKDSRNASGNDGRNDGEKDIPAPAPPAVTDNHN